MEFFKISETEESMTAGLSEKTDAHTIKIDNTSEQESLSCYEYLKKI